MRRNRTAHEGERRRQVRGLLILAAVTLMILLCRAALGGVFHAGWWRF